MEKCATIQPSEAKLVLDSCDKTIENIITDEDCAVEIDSVLIAEIPLLVSRDNLLVGHEVFEHACVREFPAFELLENLLAIQASKMQEFDVSGVPDNRTSILILVDGASIVNNGVGIWINGVFFDSHWTLLVVCYRTVKFIVSIVS